LRTKFQVTQFKAKLPERSITEKRVLPLFFQPHPVSQRSARGRYNIPMFHAHPFKLNNAAAFMGAALARACTTKTTTTKD